jgi:cell division protein FtsI/penicillin-binding protein 2
VKTAQDISAILRGVTEDEHGTGHNAAIPGLSVHGKTGTAQKARVDGRGYDPDNIFASFIGYIDGREMGLQKKLVMFIAIDEPGVKPRWGGVVAAPVFRSAMERIVSHLLTLQGNTPFQTASFTGRSLVKG